MEPERMPWKEFIRNSILAFMIGGIVGMALTILGF